MNVSFLFSGQGAQTVGMGHDLAEHNAAARAVFERADTLLNKPLSAICFSGPQETLTDTLNCQPAIYTMSMAALAAFRERFPAVTPLGTAGLSLGEYGAMAAADVFTFDEGLLLLAKRAQFMDEACQALPGSMACVLGGDNAVIESVCSALEVDVANYNAPGQTVISGEKDKIAAAVTELKARGLRKVLPLAVSGGFHSRLMKTAGDRLAVELEKVPMNAPKIIVEQNVVGTRVKDCAAIRRNLAEQVSGSVRWESCVRDLIAAGTECFIEFGPGNVLTGLVKRIAPDMQTANINSVESLENFSISL